MKPYEGSHLSCERGGVYGVIVVWVLCGLLKVPDEN